ELTPLDSLRRLAVIRAFHLNLHGPADENYIPFTNLAEKEAQVLAAGHRDAHCHLLLKTYSHLKQKRHCVLNPFPNLDLLLAANCYFTTPAAYYDKCRTARPYSPDGNGHSGWQSKNQTP